MKTHLLSLLAGTVGMATIGVAQASEPMVLSERQMGQVTAGSTMVVTSGDVLASFAELSGSLPISVLADVQAFLNGLQMGQVTAEGTIVVTTGDVLASVAKLQQSGSLPISVLDVQALLNGLQMGQVTAGSTMVVTSGDSITFTITSTPIVAF